MVMFQKARPSMQANLLMGMDVLVLKVGQFDFAVPRPLDPRGVGSMRGAKVDRELDGFAQMIPQLCLRQLTARP
ncbi:hypothetical protein ABZ917_31275 [Nonomuraea wenchangensis]